MYYEEFDEQEQQKLAETKSKKKQKQATMLIALILIGGITYYFLGYLPEERSRIKQEIEEAFKENYLVFPEKLDKSLWEEKESWEEHLNSLFLPSQVKAFGERMLKAIERKAEELDEEEREKPKKLREEAIKNIKNSLEENEDQLLYIQKAIENFTKKINKTPIDDLSTVQQEANSLILEQRNKRKRLYWLIPTHNWADRWLMRNKQSLDSIWNELAEKLKDGRKTYPPYFDARAVYRIQFPPSLWNDLSEKEKQLAKANGHSELTLRNEVSGYRFSPLIEEWEQKVKVNPVRGEIDPNDLSNLDNNALFYGAPRTGKSIMAEKLAYEADRYPLVVIQGSTLTPNKANTRNNIDVALKFFFTISSISYDLEDDYGFAREEDGEVRYILLIDEADQICTTNLLPPSQVSIQLTFLKECMGSDNKSEESKNLWIAATNHLDSINEAVYQAGRLSNPLCFSWTLGEFINYSDQAGISNKFPQHWMEAKTLNDEDNKWINEFNKIIFDGHFLPFWNKFINSNPNAEYEPDKDDDTNQGNSSNQNNEKVKIKWGEFFEFFWRLYDSKQLDNFEGKFINPRNPKIEEVLVKVENTLKLTANKISEDISKAIDTRLKELDQTANQTRQTIQNSQTAMSSTISRNLEEIKNRLQEIGRNMSDRTRNPFL
ncbi:AAA family ATPase [endosymbiont GvMRE of Glomus versiforme]|uniref:AAA family ATPase n=1 Tax=endosymbiont GvMRE of Glomus versiforme TaxID=2039283 RepID=UPI000EC941E7|nr:AAA family ATPase [endosymbiont GvMRE of Glomus versiforme]RHZ36061.1 Cell division protein FtsH [endosymbiont GvMRE of Glomus versiforme]